MAILNDSLILDLLTALSLLTVLGIVYFKFSYQYWKRRNVPYLEPFIPFGNIENPYYRTCPLGDKISEMYRMVKSNGWRNCGVYIFCSPTYLVVDLELVKHVMTKDFQYFTDRGIYTNEKDDPIGCHLFAIGGKKWRGLRTKLTPTFTSGKMKMMLQTLVDCGLVLERFIEDHADDKEPFDIKEILGCFSTDVIGSCAFGLNCNSFEEPNSPFRVYGKKIFTRTKYGLLEMAFAIGFPTVARFLGIRQVSKDTSDFFTKVVEDTVSYREKNNISRNDFLQLLIDIRNKGEEEGEDHLTMDEVVAQSYVFFIAGFETSSTTMTFALFELATNQVIQQKVRKEIQIVLEKHNNQITYDSLGEMKYMGQVIDETLRKYPPLSFVTRMCVEDYKLPDEDVVIEKGTRVVIPIKGIHYDEEYYQNPDKFDPERFNKENKEGRHQYAYIPFGEGPRICIGERFGIMQTKVGLICLLRKFKVKLNNKTTVPLKMSKYSFVTSTEGGIWLDVEKLGT